MLGSTTVEVQAEERDGLLFRTSHSGGLAVFPEIMRKLSGKMVVVVQAGWERGSR
jgi:hypothetical protein